MSKLNREELAVLFRELSLQVETAAFDASASLEPRFVADILEISAKLHSAADSLEGDGEADFKTWKTNPHSNSTEKGSPHGNGRS